MLKRILNVLCIIFFLQSISLFASKISHPINLNSPLGQWITLDRKSQKPTGIVEIFEHKGSLYGKIIDGFGVDQIQYCTNCTGNLKNKPVIGMTFLSGFFPDGQNQWTQGQILNPHDGKVYRGSISLADNGKTLHLRGYWGVFYRTETWIRSTK